MAEEPLLPIRPQDDPRIKALKLICILTFIGSGLGAFSYGVIGIFHRQFFSAAAQMMQKEQQELIRLLLSGGRTFFLLSALLYILSFRGAWMMWHLKRTGFHYYTVSQILVLIMPMVFIRGFQMPAFNAVLTGMFILAYSTFLRIMK